MYHDIVEYVAATVVSTIFNDNMTSVLDNTLLYTPHKVCPLGASRTPTVYSDVVCHG